MNPNEANKLSGFGPQPGSPKKRALFIFGTRPELIKVAPIIRHFRGSEKLTPVIFSTGQHEEMLQPLWKLFELQPDIVLPMKKGQSLNGLTLQILSGLEENFGQNPPELVLVQGDTTSALIGGLWAYQKRIPVAHIEAGLRTYDLQSPWPEEFNRRALGLMTKWHLAPTEKAMKHLQTEALVATSRPTQGLFDPEFHIVGNSSIDALNFVIQKISSDASLKKALDDKFSMLKNDRPMILSTIHRRESFGEELEGIFRSLIELSKKCQVVIPLHLNPNVQAAAKKVGLHDSEVVILEPQGYLEFVYLMNRASIILTDSGGIQEEAPSIQKPTLVLRKVTERPESLATGFCFLVGTHPEEILQKTNELLAKWQKPSPPYHYPYGQGDSSERILKALEKAL